MRARYHTHQSAHWNLGHNLGPGHGNWSSPIWLTDTSTVPTIPDTMSTPSDSTGFPTYNMDMAMHIIVIIVSTVIA